MCFSPQADLVGGLVLGVIGLDAARHVRKRRSHLAFAALPFLLGAHQFDEAFVWWGLQGSVPASVGRLALWIYLLFAFVVLPTYVPLAVFGLEPRGPRRRTIAGFIALGLGVSGILLVAMVTGPVSGVLGDYHLGYSIGLPAGGLVVGAYVAATCGSLIFSGYRKLAVFGLVNLLVVALLARLAIDGFASLWCAWAAVTAGAIAVTLRHGGEDRLLDVAPTG